MTPCGGRTLKERIEEGSLPVAEALGIGAQTAEGLAAIEESGEFELSRFGGAHAILGWVDLRDGRLDAAGAAFRTGMRATENDDHVYDRVSCTVARCGVGEVLLLRRRFNEALGALRRAAEYAMASPARAPFGGAVRIAREPGAGAPGAPRSPGDRRRARSRAARGRGRGRPRRGRASGAGRRRAARSRVPWPRPSASRPRRTGRGAG